MIFIEIKLLFHFVKDREYKSRPLIFLKEYWFICNLIGYIQSCISLPAYVIISKRTVIKNA